MTNSSQKAKKAAQPLAKEQKNELRLHQLSTQHQKR